MLWDLKLKVGHASRTVKDCLRWGARTSPSAPRCWSIASSAGPRALATELGDGCGPSCSATPGPNSSRPSWPNGPSATSGRAGSAMCWSPTSRRARAACATCRRCTGSANTCTAWTPAELVVWAGLLTREEYDTFERAEELPLGRALPSALHRGPATVDQLTFDMQVEVAAAWATATRRAPRGRAFHAGLLPPRHPRGRTDPHLPDRAGGAPRQARGRADGVLRAASKVRPATRGAGPPRPWPTRGLPVRQAEPAARLRRGAAHRLPAAPRRHAADRGQPAPDRRRDAHDPEAQRSSSTCC
jgi:hypothetical protein